MENDKAALFDALAKMQTHFERTKADRIRALEEKIAETDRRILERRKLSRAN